MTARAKALATALVCLALAAVPGGARAEHDWEHPVRVTFFAPVPCSVVCPYWTGTDDDACAPEPLSLPGSWADHDLVLAPPETAQKFVFFVFTIKPLVDYDSWICRQEPAADGSYHLVPGACVTTCDCDWFLGLGCPESPELLVCTELAYPDPGNGSCIPKGTPIRLRVYNWSDPTLAVDGEYSYSLKGRY